MTSAGSMKKRLAARITASLATAAAVFGIVAFTFAGGGASSNQADAPWDCDRYGQNCDQY
ncbi:hypothetical protein [Streptomyces sp. NL15-2K]|uniref:hypothetical protein n=1 Tax=Streptomyces sp. NL15-2K TaxID=376149 RepID=UPI000F561DC9|nr:MULTISPECIES: hypothetical protein [Actinomycetes]WKX09482.1 hypothetical protein Q4V64_19100 [Kutzneria buriramensis]GCB49008.1 hypothetical protein SNL152K_6338 [Streptomyces sp. NL15-2K]